MVKAMYEPLKYASRENRIASEEAILQNVETIRQLDGILGLPADEDIEMIVNRIITKE